jgi:hypothetical protein
MPNHVKNVLKFKHLTPDDVDFIVNTIATEMERPDTVDKQYAIDFNKIIPEPRFEEECPPDCIVNSESHISPDPEKPWFDWYRWRLKYWDTKWKAYDCYSKIGKSYVTFVFSTAWSMAYPIIEQLRLMGYEFELRYADEDYGSNCGIVTWSHEQGFNHYPAEELINPDRFARNLWNSY